MSDYQSYSTYRAPTEETPHHSPRYDSDAGRTSSIIIRDGVAYADSSSSNSVTSAELNPHFQDGTVFATAKSMNSIGVQEITPETLITIGGVQSTVRFFEKEGFIHRDANGNYVEGSGDAQEAPQAAPVEDTADRLAMAAEGSAGIDCALEGVGDQSQI